MCPPCLRWWGRLCRRRCAAGGCLCARVRCPDADAAGKCLSGVYTIIITITTGYSTIRGEGGGRGLAGVEVGGVGEVSCCCCCCKKVLVLEKKSRPLFTIHSCSLLHNQHETGESKSKARVKSSGSRADWPSARCSRRSCRRRSARRAARRGRSQSSGRRARCGQRVRSAQTAEEMQRRRTRKRTPLVTTKHTKQGGHPKQHGR